MSRVRIRRLDAKDWPAVSRIYVEGIETGNATFETGPPSWEDWDSSHLEFGRLVAEVDGGVVGWVALSPVSQRHVYRGVAEPSIYVAGSARGQGVGVELMTAMIEASEAGGIWTLQTAIFPENTSSISLHQRFGFRMIGTRERIGLHNGRWRDTVFLERRSDSGDDLACAEFHLTSLALMPTSAESRRGSQSSESTLLPRRIPHDANRD